MQAPIFIVGSARSGTTLLRMILNAHPWVAIPPEGRLITELWRGREEESVAHFLSELERHPRFRLWEMPIEEVKRELGNEDRLPYSQLASAPYRAYARIHVKKLWGDKAPRYVNHIPFLDQLFPEAKFIHLIRDGRNVALSYAGVPFGPKTVPRAARLWRERVEAGMRHGRPLGERRYWELHYEQLIDDFEPSLQRLCRFLEIPFDPALLSYEEEAARRALPTARLYNPRVLEPPSRTRSFEKEMSPFQVALFEAIAGPTLETTGYRRACPHPPIGARFLALLGSWGLPIGRLASKRGKGKPPRLSPNTPPSGRG